MEPEQVVENIQTSGAEAVVSEVSSEVANVETSLEEHREESEERHDEILEGEKWLEELLQKIQKETSEQLVKLRESLLSMRESQALIQEQLSTLITNLKLSTDLKPSTLETSEPEVITAEVAEPEAVEEDVQEEPKTPKKRRRIV